MKDNGQAPQGEAGDEQMTAEQIISLGYSFPRKLSTGEWAALRNMLFTTGLFVGITPTTYDFRYCYEHEADALAALLAWTGEGDPSGLWIKKKGRGVDCLGPGAVA